MKRFITCLLFVLSTLVPLHARAVANTSVIGSVPFRGGSDLAFSGHYAFVGSYDGYGSPGNSDGGLHIIDISDPSAPVQTGFLHCPGYQDDVGVWRNIVVMGMHDSGPLCAPVHRGGLRLVDWTDPAAPKQLSFLRISPNGTHTLTIVGDSGYVYANPGGLSTAAAGKATTIVDIRDPVRPKIVGTFTPPHSTGCHDINVNAAATRAYCAGSNVTQIWDITDPVSPVVISEIFNPAIFFHHGAVPSPDGKLLAIADEAFGAHVCDGVGASTTGALWFYDVSNESIPFVVGYIQPARAAGFSEFGWCTAHNFTFIPGTTLLSIASYTAGTQIIDYANPTLPAVKGWVTPDGANTWSSYYHDGHVFTGDMSRGFDVIAMDGLA